MSLDLHKMFFVDKEYSKQNASLCPAVVKNKGRYKFTCVS